MNKKWIANANCLNEASVWIENTGSGMVLAVLPQHVNKKVKLDFALDIADKLNKEEAK